jgi:hypothetical protein
VKSIARAHAIALTDRDRGQLAERFPTNGPQDPRFAQRIGFQFRDSKKFFG